MATITGEVVMPNFNGLHHPVGAAILVGDGERLLTRTKVDEDNRFRAELADEIHGTIEIRLGRHDAAPVMVEATGLDIDVVLLYNPINNYFA